MRKRFEVTANMLHSKMRLVVCGYESPCVPDKHVTLGSSKLFDPVADFP